jgi:hypothetical protein
MAAKQCVPWCDLGAATHIGADGEAQQGLRIEPQVSCGDGCLPAFTVAWLCLGADNVDWNSGFVGNTYQPLRVVDFEQGASVQVTATITVSCSPDGEAAQCSSSWMVRWEPGARFAGLDLLNSTCPGT